MKSIIQYITEAEQSKRMLNPIPWYEFIKLYKDKTNIPDNADNVNAEYYLNEGILNSKIFTAELNIHGDRYNTNDETCWYVICGNYKMSWTKFNVNEFFDSLGTPKEQYINKNWSIFIFDDCVFIKLEENNTAHWTAICSKDMLYNMNLL